MVIVTKFGGTSVDNGKTISRVIDIVRKDERRRIVVVSSPAGLTDTLLGVANENYAKPDVPQETYRAQIKTVQKKFDDTLAHYKIESDFLDSLYAQLEKELKARKNKSREEYQDAVAVFGERINAKLIAEIMKVHGLKARFVRAEDMGMYTDSQFGNGTLNDLSPTLIRQYFEKVPENEICVVTGYYGVDNLHRPVTFGRGGSNYVAAVIASAVKAELLENFSDQKGICRANPKLIPEAGHDIISEMTFEEARELVYSGAKILHPMTIIPLARAKVPIRVRSTFDYDHIGTLIHSNVKNQRKGVKGIAEKSMYRIKLGKIGMNEIKGYIARLSAIFNEVGIDIHLPSAGIDSIAYTFTVPSSGNGKSFNVEKLKMLEERIKNDPLVSPDTCDVENVTVICVVGEGIQNIPGINADLQAALENEKVIGFNHGPSGRNIIFMVAPENAREAIVALYKTVKKINKTLDDGK